MRTYSSLLLFENLFDSIPTDSPDMVNLGRSIIEPNLIVLENDCRTTLGKFEEVNNETEGIVELATGIPLSRARIEMLLGQGIYEVATRHTSTCITKDGICTKCFAATYPDKPVPKLNDRVDIPPEFLVNSEVIVVNSTTKEYSIRTAIDSFDKVYVYSEGVLLKPEVHYKISGSAFILTEFPEYEKNVVLRCVKRDTFPFVAWLAKTFSGAIFGMDPLPAQALPVRSLLLSSLLDENRLQLVSEYLTKLRAIPANNIAYIDTIKDPLEKGLHMLALYCLYSNVTY